MGGSRGDRAKVRKHGIVGKREGEPAFRHQSRTKR